MPKAGPAREALWPPASFRTGACPLPSQGLQPRGSGLSCPNAWWTHLENPVQEAGPPAQEGRPGSRESGGGCPRAPAQLLCARAPVLLWGGGSWHPPALDTADPGWRKQRSAPAWPERAVFSEQLPTKGAGAGRAQHPGEAARSLAFYTTGAALPKRLPDLGAGARALLSLRPIFPLRKLP